MVIRSTTHQRTRSDVSALSASQASIVSFQAESDPVAIEEHEVWLANTYH